MLMVNNYKKLVGCLASEPGLTCREKRLANPVRSVCLLMDFSWLIIQRHFIVQKQI